MLDCYNSSNKSRICSHCLVSFVIKGEAKKFLLDHNVPEEIIDKYLTHLIMVYSYRWDFAGEIQLKPTKDGPPT